MPTHEAIVNNLIPQQVEKPIPVRTVNTRMQRLESTNSVQPITNNSPVAESATPEESVRLSPQLTALARKEQAYRQREQALKLREKEIEAKLAEAEKFESLKAKMGNKDFSEAEALGLDYEGYTQYKLDKAGDANPQEVKMKALEDKLAAFEKDKEESAAQLFEETVAEYRKEITKAVSENLEFSTIKGIEGGDKAVLQLILDSFEEDGVELSVNEAAKLVEEKLVERGKLYTSLPKFKTTESVAPKVLPRPMVGKTLTNDMTVSNTNKPLQSLQHLSEAERYAEARRRVMERLGKG
jgi:hypothetical protein